MKGKQTGLRMTKSALNSQRDSQRWRDREPSARERRRAAEREGRKGMAMPNEADVHDVPQVSSEDRMHDLDRNCWCKPAIVAYPDQTQVVHHDERGSNDRR